MPFRSCEAKQAHNKAYHQAHVERSTIRHWERAREIKEECLAHYGDGKLVCVHCGFSDIRALSIDHIEGNGSEHRRLNHLKRGAPFYRWLLKRGYPGGYQTLCMNCQYIKRYTNGESGGIRLTSPGRVRW